MGHHPDPLHALGNHHLDVVGERDGVRSIRFVENLPVASTPSPRRTTRISRCRSIRRPDLVGPRHEQADRIGTAIHGSRTIADRSVIGDTRPVGRNRGARQAVRRPKPPPRRRKDSAPALRQRMSDEHVQAFDAVGHAATGKVGAEGFDGVTLGQERFVRAAVCRATSGSASRRAVISRITPADSRRLASAVSRGSRSGSTASEAGCRQVAGRGLTTAGTPSGCSRRSR